MTCNVEDFEWLTGRESILLRPDAYVGSIEPIEETLLVCNQTGNFSYITYAVSPIFMNNNSSFVVQISKHGVGRFESSMIS